MKRRLLLLICTLGLAVIANAQAELAQVINKNNSATGLGVYLHFGFPIKKSSEVTGEFGFYYFAPQPNHMLMFPMLAGYRYILNGTRSGIYLEPQAGYSFGTSDIHKTDGNGNLIYQNDETVDQKVSGMTGAMTVGYLFPKMPLQLGVRFAHIFVSGDPTQSIISFRASYVVSFGRR
jgi:hypothetical protein